MSTFNATSSTNNVNTVLYTWSTKMVWHTDRSVTGVDRGGEVQAVENLGVGVAAGEPFTLLS